MIVVSRERIERFINTHKRGSKAAGALRAWFHEAENANWRNPAELKQHYPRARPVGKGKGVTIFNIRGNGFRLVTRINYKAKVVKIEFIGTHEEYDRIDVGEVTWKG